MFTLLLVIGIEFNTTQIKVDFKDLQTCQKAIESIKTEYGKKAKDISIKAKCLQN